MIFLLHGPRPSWIPIIIYLFSSTTTTTASIIDNLDAPNANYYNSPSLMKSYSGYSLLRTEPIGREDLAKSLLILDGMRGVHFWKYPLVNGSSDILASPAQLRHIQGLLTALGLSHSVMIQDVEELLRNENPQQIASPYDAGPMEMEMEQMMETKATVASSAFFQRYQRYDAIQQYAQQLAGQDSRVTYTSVGSSSQGRQIGLVTISSGGGGGTKPGIWIDGGMHAREWISPATATYIISRLVAKDDPIAVQLVADFDWYILPVINADGYEHTHSADRMWRKTRSQHPRHRCIGVDPNRNWGFHWAEGGSSTDSCSDIYHGPNAFSEPETLSVARAIKARPNIKMYLTFHSYSQLWLVPYGYARGSRPSDYSELVRMAQIGAKALYSTHRTSYRIGTAPDLLYPASGGSDDWAKGAAGIKYSYCLELRDTGSYGFLLPASQIVPTGQETWAGIAAMGKELKKMTIKVVPPQIMTTTKATVTTTTTKTTKKPQKVVGAAYVNADKELNSPSGGV